MTARLPSIDRLVALSDRLKRLKDIIDPLFWPVSIAATVIAGLIALFGGEFLYDQTARFQQNFDADVKPAIAYGETVARDALQSGHDTRESFGKQVGDRLLADKKQDVIMRAAGDLNDLVECHRSWFCDVKDYRRYQDPIQVFWYTFAAYIAGQRGKTERTDFAVALEDEAGAILEDLRQRGLVPKPR